MRNADSRNDMIQSKQQLFEAIEAAGLPKNLLRVWGGDIPKSLRSTLQDPSSLFDAFLAHPEGFPSSDELVILWQTNGESIVAFLPSSGVFFRHYLEDGPEEGQVLGLSYQQLLSDLFAKLIVRETPESEIEECAEFLNFRYLPQLRDFVRNDPSWEGNAARFIKRIEFVPPSRLGEK